MKISFFSAQPYDRDFFNLHNQQGAILEYFEMQLDVHTVKLIDRSEAVCVFVNDKVNAAVIQLLAAKGVQIIALRCAGFNNVDIEVAKQYGIKVCRVPAYSPASVAEHTAAMILTLNRKTHKAYNRVREQNFALNGLLGFEIRGKIVGVIGAGNIGKAFCLIMMGFGCTVLAYDTAPDEALQSKGVVFKTLPELIQQSDIVSLHCPLNPQTHHIIDANNIGLMKKGVMLINTSRGGLIDTQAAITALKSEQIGYLGIDVYEQEEKLFFKDLSASVIEDDVIQRLMSFPNVLVTAHQAFFTREALTEITVATLSNIQKLHNGEALHGAAQLA